MPALATITDYELLIGPVATSDVDRLTVLLDVATVVVGRSAPLLYPWIAWPLDESGDPVDPGPVPSPAVLVTCQVASRLLADPDGGEGAVQMERVGQAQTHYNTDWTTASGLLPSGWRLMLEPWRMPELASVRLEVDLPSEGYDWLYNWFYGEQEPA